MDIRPLTDALSVAGQITPADLPALSGLGFRSIICNRPDGESAEQPGWQALARLAEQAGLGFHYLPVAPGKVTPELARAFGALLEQLPGPVLAYCRSGLRSASLWALSEVGHRDTTRIIEAATQAGFDLRSLLQPHDR